MPAGAALWGQLRSDRILCNLIADAADAIPRRDEILAASSPQCAWRSYRTGVLSAVNRARDVAGLPPTPICDTADTPHPSREASSNGDVEVERPD
jgi:hypothetical protein